MSPKPVLCTLCLAMFVPSLAHAIDEDRTILLLLKSVPGAPTPAQIIDYTNTWPHSANPPLQAFSIKDPQASSYLLPDRATGDFLAWLGANPNSARAKLEAYQLMLYPSPDDIPVALAALQADPYVEAASVPLRAEFHTAAAADAGTVEPLHLENDTLYGWDDMNLASAWEITGGGYAQVAHIDMGVSTNHAALRTFVGSSYVGGNLMLAASKDVSLTGQPAQPGFDPANVDEGKAMFIPASPCTAVDAYLPPNRLGHGTHTAGLLGANDAAGLGVRGTCKHCGNR